MAGTTFQIAGAELLKEADLLSGGWIQMKKIKRQ
jgi:hypothetical protein